MYTNKQIWNVSYPILLSLFAQNIVNITDTAFLGHLGEVELGASALGGVFYLAIFMIGFGFSTGAQILMARRNGENKYSQISPIFVQGTFFLIIIALLVIFGTLRYASPILGLMIKSPQVLASTIEFLDWRTYGIFFAFINVMFRAFFVSITKTKTLTISAIIMGVVNIFLDYAMIFGHFGFQIMGIAGAAIASVISEFASVAFFIIYSLSVVNIKKYGFFEKSAYTLKQLPHILNVSVWTMIQYFLSVGTWFIFFLATEHLGERSLAVSNIVRSVSTLLFMLVGAYATTANTLVSNMMGEGKASFVPQLLKKIIFQSSWIILPTMLLMFIFPYQIMQVYSEDVSLIKASIASLIVLVSSYFFTTPGSIYFQFVSGTGNTRSALFMEFCTLVFYMSYVILVAFVFKMDVAVCWFAEHIYWGLLLIFSLIYMRKSDWQNKKI
ncbi:MAG: MATE family efflux transporter [Bacteroidales bacterium]|nr:MATE family efflux transporter [Bacteroidales bacterium]